MSELMAQRATTLRHPIFERIYCGAAKGAHYELTSGNAEGDEFPAVGATNAPRTRGGVQENPPLAGHDQHGHVGHRTGPKPDHRGSRRTRSRGKTGRSGNVS